MNTGQDGDGDEVSEGGNAGDEYELSSPSPTLSQLIPPTQSLEELLPKGGNKCQKIE